MFEVREGVDYRHTRVGGHLRDRIVRIGAQHDHIHPALQVARHVGDGFALTQRRIGLINEDGVTTHGVDAGFKAQARAQAGLFEHQHHLFGVESTAVLAGIALDLMAQLEDGAHFGTR